MPDEAWKQAIKRWRALSSEEKHRRRMEAIPESVARSFAFEGEPLPDGWVEEEKRRIAEILRQEKAQRDGDSSKGKD